MARSITYTNANIPMKCEHCREEGDSVRASYICSRTPLTVEAIPREGLYLCDECVLSSGKFQHMWMIQPLNHNTGEWDTLLPAEG